MLSGKAVKCLIFDWDGTLMDSSSRIVKCLQDAAKEMQLQERSVEQLSHIIGLSLDGAVNYLYPEMDAQTRLQYAQAYREQYLYKNKDPEPLFAGVVDMLNAWRDEGYWLAVATGKSRVGLKKHLEELDLGAYFVSTKTADETASKPDPLMLKEIVQELDINIDEAVMIGDTTHDVDMAHNIKMPSIGLAQGAHDKAKLAASQPTVLLDSIQELPAYLNAYKD